jgi:hypothetical protein
MASSGPKLGTRPVFKFSKRSNDFITQSVLMVNASLRCLHNVSGVNVLSPGFLDFYWSAGFGTFLQVSAPASHWLENCANFTPTPEEGDQYSANHS